MTTMAYRNTAGSTWVRSAFGGFIDTMGLVSAAHECSMARRERRSAAPAALQTLGIDELAFTRVLNRR